MNRQLFFGELGGWRSRLLWRGFGIVLLQLFLQCTIHVRSLEDLSQLPASLWCYGAAGVLLALLGPRPTLLAFASAAMFAFLHHVIFDAYFYQLAEEYVPLALLPAVGLGLALALARTHPAESGPDAAVIDDAFLSLFRTSLIVLMTFAIFHKLNADFFDPSVSCANGHFYAVERRVPALAMLAPAMPYFAILGEISIPVLLILVPRLGLVATLLVMAYIGHRGATTFTLFVMVHSIAFLEPKAGDWLRDGLRRRWIWLLGLIVLATGASLLIYGRVSAQWLRYWTFEIAIVLGAFGLAHVLLGASNGSGTGLRWQALFERPDSGPLFGRARLVRATTLTIVLVGFINGFTPYLGLKHRFSQAMFANLRADQERWNHFLVPEAVRLREMLPYVRLTQGEVRGVLAGDTARRGLGDGLYTPDYLLAHIENANRSRLRLAFRAEFDGVVHETRNAAFDQELLAWLKELDQGRRFYQKLTLEGPQHCIH